MTKIGDAAAEGAKSRIKQSRNKIFLDDDCTIRSVLHLIWHTTPRSLVDWLSGIPLALRFIMPRSTSKGAKRATRTSSPIPTSPGRRPASPRRSPPKRSRPKSPSRALRRGIRRRVSFAEGGDDSIPPVSDESDVDGPDHTGGCCVDTVGAARSSGGGRAPEKSSELFDSLQRADDPLMQQLGSFLSAYVAETADLHRRLAASEERARINQLLRNYEERGVSTFHHDRWQMAYVFTQLILPHIVDCPTRVYFENLD